MEQLQGTSPQHFEPTSQGCHILTLNSKGVPLGNSPKISIPDYQLKISTGCSLSLLQVPLVHLNPFCCTFYVPLLPLHFLKLSKGSKGTSQIHLNQHELTQGAWTVARHIFPVFWAVPYHLFLCLSFIWAHFGVLFMCLCYLCNFSK